MKIKLPTGSFIKSENPDIIDMYLNMGGTEVKEKKVVNEQPSKPNKKNIKKED